MPDEPESPSGLPPYPGSAPPPPPPSGPLPYPGGSAGPDPWYEPPRQHNGDPGGYYYPPNSPPPGPWGAPPPFGGSGSGLLYASYLSRAGGLILDAILLGVVSLIYLLPDHVLRTNAKGHVNLPPGTILVTLLVGALYAGLMIGLRGQTLGMMAVRVRAVDATTGGPIGVWRAIGRDLLERLFGFLFLLPLLIDLGLPFFDPRRQTLHDKLTNTVVVRA